MKQLAIVLGVVLVLAIPGCSGMGQRIELAANTPSADLGGKTPLEVLGVSAVELAFALPGLILAIQEGNIPVAIQIGGEAFGPGTEAWKAIMIVIHAALQTPAPAPVPKGSGKVQLQWRYAA